MENGQLVQRNFSIYEHEDNIVKQVAIDNGWFNLSKAIRHIINDYAARNDIQPPTEPEPEGYQPGHS